jgi:hypothetical protein
MNMSLIDMEKYTADNYFQAINQSLNKVIKEDFIPGYI